ncbi:iron-containing alcohol dehydrogenase [Prosthecobacter sp.]|uniref:iron-containing alcohol dehydrogenase n=1 Tax=Prosthecobacter sp. TaxID=1965333 RepID=UPI003782EE11
MAAVGVMMPHVIRFNSQDPEIAAIYKSYFDGDLADRVSELLWEARMPRNIAEYGVKEEHLHDLAELDAKQWTAQFNPRLPNGRDFVELYRSAL